MPAAAGPVNTSHPHRVVGRGTAASCTSTAVLGAVRAGGVIRFSCGPAPVVIRMSATAKVMNTSRRVVLDGAGLVTLSGQGRRRILYMDTCDQAQVWTTSHCQNQASPVLVIQNMRLIDGNSTGQRFDGGGGGAIFARGGRLRIVDSTFAGNRCERDGLDIGGGAVRALSQCRGCPVFVVGSHFTGNICSNGGALTIGASSFTDNHANEGGGAISFVSNVRTGTIAIRDSVHAFRPPGCRRDNAPMVPEAPIEPTDGGLAPAGDGWFVLNAREAQWFDGHFGAYTRFEGQARFPKLGVNIGVLAPGQPACWYHGEDEQEDFLVLSGTCLLLIEGEERLLKAWDFVHCPPWTEHVFVGAGEEPCAILAVGTRSTDAVIYPVSELAQRHRAGVERETRDPREAYAEVRPDAPVGYRERWLRD